jgi:zinc protease
MKIYHRLRLTVLFFFVLFLLISCQQSSDSFEIKYEKYVLDNGLEVILHQDHSDPIVAVATLVHAGSNREKPGRTGFAHFFEHMSFNDSENVPRGANRKLIPELGGSRNGGTWSDGTVYYEVVPTDAFEKILWIDSDRLGYMINTVTEAALEREKQVVKNEKRQRVDNQPYGHTSTVIRSHLYPPDHPYHWTVIGDLRDLQAATLEDVKEFYDRYYGANNFTLVIAGDIDITETKELVNRWFGEIRKGPIVDPIKPIPVTLEKSISLYHEDNFAKLPEIRITYPVPEQYHKDSYALQVLGDILSGSKKAPLYKVIVESHKLAPNVSSSYVGNELAGEFALRVRANAGTDLNDVYSVINEGFEKFENEGFSENELKRIKAQIETQLYRNLETVLNKAFQLAIYNEYAGDPGFITSEAKLLQRVSKQDVIDVYNKYIKDKNYVLTSFVPKGQQDLIVKSSTKAEVFEEEIIPGGSHEEVSQGDEASYEKTPTKHDRSEPPLGTAPLLKSPTVWSSELSNGVKILGIHSAEIPLVNFELMISGGHWLDPREKAGIASLLTDLMMEGTVNRTPVELEEAIGLLGADISIYIAEEEIRLSASCLSRNFESTLALMEEMLLEPRWDEKEYERLKRELETYLKGREGNPTAMARVAYNKLLYGDDHILALPNSGIPSTSKNIQISDLKDFYQKNFSPHLASFHIVGDVSKERVKDALSNLENRWEKKEVVFPECKLPTTDLGQKVFFIDIPGSKQSVIYAGKLTISAKDENYNNLVYTNQILGGGSSGRFFQVLRIEKGYTYGAYSRIGGTLEIAPFTVATSVRANATLESLKLIRELIKDYKETFGEEEMKITKNQIIKGNTRAFESQQAKLSVLRRMSKFGLPASFVEDGQKELTEMQLEDFHKVIETYIDESQMFYLVIGDGKTQFKPTGQFGYGSAKVLDIYGNPK